MNTPTNNNGGPAFPVSCSANGTPLGVAYQNTDGMTLRDYFAGMALQAMVSNPNLNDGTGYYDGWNTPAKAAYEAADAMLAARKEEG